MMKNLLMVLLFPLTVYGTELSITSLDYAQVTYVKASQSSNGSWCFAVEVRHNDEGWEHYADAWQVVNLEGVVLGERVLLHPHENEQPFTRSLCGVKVPTDVKEVAVRAKCNLHDFEGASIILDLSVPSKSIAYSVIK